MTNDQILKDTKGRFTWVVLPDGACFERSRVRALARTFTRKRDPKPTWLYHSAERLLTCTWDTGHMHFYGDQDMRGLTAADRDWT